MRIKIFPSIIFALLISLHSCREHHTHVPDGFVELGAYLSNAEIELRYYSTNNFIGDTIRGYERNKCFISREAAEALAKVASEVSEDGYILKIFDAYRPQRAVDHFVEWAKRSDDTLMKYKYYPELDKDRLFPEGYIMERSGHTRGSTVDLTLVYRAGPLKGQEIDMGSGWDYFGARSWGAFRGITDEQYQNRQYLKEVMVMHGFQPIQEEWWHFSLEDEPYPDTYFNFPIR